MYQGEKMQDELSDGDNLRVIPQAGFHREKDVRSILTYWNSMRRNGDVPRRSDIDPRGIQNLLGHAFVAERIASGLARFRIAGSFLNDLMGMEVRGMPVSSFIEPDFRDQLSNMIVDMFDAPATLQVRLKSRGKIGKPELDGMLVMLPLRSDLGDISRVLGCLVAQGSVGCGPRRFEIADSRIQRIELPGTAAELNVPLTPRPYGMAESQRRFRPKQPVKGSERPYLRVVK